MSQFMNNDADIALPPLAHAGACRCALHARRRLGGALLGSGLLAAAVPAWSRNDEPVGVAECKRSQFTKAVPAEEVEAAAAQQYRQMLQAANQQNALAPAEHPQVRRLRYIAQRLIPFSTCNPRAARWQWEVNLIGAKQINAFCMPGGKIAFYTGILSTLQLSDDEVAMIMGHEISHALLEHARERMGKTAATRFGLEVGAALLGLGNAGRMVGDLGAQLLTLKFSRSDESEADALGLVLAARAGYQPQAGVTLWQKMLATNKGAPPQWMSTHPSGTTRIHEIEGRLPRVEPVFAQAAKPDQRFGPPAASPQPARDKG